jgi:hypothetical protein
MLVAIFDKLPLGFVTPAFLLLNLWATAIRIVAAAQAASVQ